MKKNYDTKLRFYSYGAQIEEILFYVGSIEKSRFLLLNIGTGTGFMRKYFSERINGKEVKVFELDIEKNYNPAIVADIKEGIPLKKNSFDIVICTQVFQYISYKKFLNAMREVNNILKKDGIFIMSLPDANYYITFNINIPRLRKDLIFRFNFLKPKVSFDSIRKWGKNYWEINRKGYPEKIVFGDISNIFIIKKEYVLKKHPYHHFFVLKKK